MGVSECIIELRSCMIDRIKFQIKKGRRKRRLIHWNNLYPCYHISSTGLMIILCYLYSIPFQVYGSQGEQNQSRFAIPKVQAVVFPSEFHRRNPLEARSNRCTLLLLKNSLLSRKRSKPYLNKLKPGKNNGNEDQPYLKQMTADRLVYAASVKYISLSKET
jgi:hypothetical protein